MGKKKPFVDKKRSSTYHLLHRSQRDVTGDILWEEHADAVSKSGMILWPSPQNKPETNEKVLQTAQEKQTMAVWRQKLAAVGLIEEDPERYLKPITGTGTFLSATGKVATIDPRSTHFDAEDALMEVDRHFESIPLTSECMDDDMAQILFGDFENDEFEELNDDFVLQAAEEPEEQTSDEAEFDYDAHIQKLMEKAKRERSGGIPGSQDDFFSNVKPLHEQDDDDDEDSWDQHFGSTAGVVPALSPDEERALCEKFEETLLEYDSDECGECPNDEITGLRPLEGDTQVEAALDEFMQERDDEVFMQGVPRNSKLNRGSGFSALVGRKMVHASALGDINPADENPPENIEDILAYAKERLTEAPLQPPPEEILIDGKSYFSERERNPFDCESILSTFSNLDNNPVTIDASRRRKKKKSKATSSAGSIEPMEQILLSNKTGLPIGVLPGRGRDEDLDDTIASVNRGEARDRKESQEAKKARKQTVKQERQMARLQKKATKEVFKEEFQKRMFDSHNGEDVAGKTVFRFS